MTVCARRLHPLLSACRTTEKLQSTYETVESERGNRPDVESHEQLLHVRCETEEKSTFSRMEPEGGELRQLPLLEAVQTCSETAREGGRREGGGEEDPADSERVCACGWKAASSTCDVPFYL